MKKFVIDNPAPFIVPIANWSGELAQSSAEPLRTITSWPRGGSFAMASPVIAPATHQGSVRVNDPMEPLPTVTCANRGELTLISPTLIQSGYGERQGQEPRVPGLGQPLGTVVAGGIKHALTSSVLVGAGGPEYSGKPATADQPVGTLMTQNHRAVATVFMAQMNGGFNTTFAKGMDEPLTTVTNTGSQQQLVSASLATLRRNCVGRGVDEPVPTMTAGAEHHALLHYKLSPEHEDGALRVAAFLIKNHRAVATAFMAQMNGGFNTTDAKGMDEPLTTVTNTGSQQQLVSANLVHLRGNCDARAAEEPLRTISAAGEHHGLVSAFMERAFGASVGQRLEEPAPTTTAGGGGKSSLVSLKLSPEHEAGALRVAAFLISYYGTENISACDSPAPTITTKDCLAMVTVMVKGTPYVIVDICLRMLKPAELYKAQGFPADYVISHGADGKPFTKTQQVHMCGNSVSPAPMAALAKANDPWLTQGQLTSAA